VGEVGRAVEGREALLVALVDRGAVVEEVVELRGAGRGGVGGAVKGGRWAGGGARRAARGALPADSCR
jgi:hypothetical protein